MIPDEAVVNLVRRIHESPGRAALVITGAGARALAWLLGEAGASRTVLDAQVPYAMAALNEYTGRPADQHVSPEEAVQMADAAYTRALRLRPDDADYPVAGVSCTATVATDRHKRGEHRCHVTWRDARRRVTASLILAKGSRDRSGEEEVVSRLVLNALAEACGLAAAVDPGLLPEESLVRADATVS